MGVAQQHGSAHLFEASRGFASMLPYVAAPSPPGTRAHGTAQCQHVCALFTMVCSCRNHPAGTRKPGLVLQWSGADPPASAQVQPQPVSDLPSGWKTLPDMSWDAGEHRP